MARSFSTQERDNIRRKFITACTESWMKYGYKKTSVDDLCRRVGISKGAFYLFFQSKEELFCEVLCIVQRQIYDGAVKLISGHAGKTGVVEAMKYVYREYDRNNFLRYSDGSDFIMLKSKLLPEQLAEVNKLGNMNYRLFLDIQNLKLKVSEEMAASIIYLAIMGIRDKEILPENHYKVFDFFVEHLVDDLYEQTGKETVK